MSLKSFENYSAVASIEEASDTEVAGRYEFQASAERRAILDIQKKLTLESDDTLLEIGCGPGNILIPLSYLVAQSSGIDNQAALERLEARIGTSKHIHTYPGDFLAMDAPEVKFDKILIYSVLQYLDSPDVVIQFVSRALSLISPGGKLLVGDLPNKDKKQRFSKSSAGSMASAEWRTLLAEAGEHPISQLEEDDQLVSIDDNLVFSLLRAGRERGFESYLLPQPSDLPFGNTREDILFVAPE